MRLDGIEILRFVNAVRRVRGLPPLARISFASADEASEQRCVVALATGLRVGGSDDPRWDSHFVIRCENPRLAVAIGMAGRPHNSLGEVALPEEVEKLAVLFDQGECREADLVYVREGEPGVSADRRVSTPAGPTDRLAA
jgi:hypothetical protein